MAIKQFLHRISEYYRGFTPEREPKKAPARLGGASGLIWGATLAHLGATLANLGATLVHLHLAWSSVERQSQPILIASSMGTRIGAGTSYRY